MAAYKEPEKSTEERVERTRFKSFLATNLNYFGNLTTAGTQPVKKDRQ